MDCCDNKNIISVMAHCNDCFFAQTDNEEYGPDYVDSKFGIGSGDDVEFEYCSNCGKIKGEFPLDLE